MFDWLKKKKENNPAPPTGETTSSSGLGETIPSNQSARALGTWAAIDIQKEKLEGYVYLDADAGLSLKGGPVGTPALAEQPPMTVRLPIGHPLRLLTPDEVAARGYPATPGWLRFFGPQPSPDDPWRLDKLLHGRFHPSFVNDLQVLVHDGETRRTKRQAELCFVRITAAEPSPRRRPGEGSYIYVGTLLNQPTQLASVKQGDTVRFLVDRKAPHPLLVTPTYIAERDGWIIEPCNKCGFGEAFDPPSVMAKTRFPDAPAGAEMQTFSSFCPFCKGTQMVTRET